MSTLVVLVPGAVGATGGGRTGGLREQAPVDRVEAFVQAVDVRGTPLGPAISVDSQTGRPDSAAPPRASTVGVAARGSGKRSLQASGCYTAWVTRSRSGYFGETLWKYTHEK